MRGELLDEVAHETTQEGAATEADLGHAGLEQLAGIQHHQVAVELGVDRHLGHDAHTQAQAHIGLDHVGVSGGEHHLGRQATVAEGFVQFRAAGEAEDVGNDGVFGQRLEGQLRQFGQGVPLGHDDATVPAVAGHHHQVTEQLQGLGGDGEVDGAVGGHLGDLHRGALVHVQGDVGVLLDEAADHWRQCVARLGMGGGDGERALLLVGEFLGDLLDALDLAQDFPCRGDDAFPGRRHASEVLAAASEYFDAEFVFQQADLLADARLRGIKTLCSGGHVQVVVRHFPDVAQLLELHRQSSKQ
ncbi:hypothetical protein D3C85_604420 [compost metagenome]